MCSLVPILLRFALDRWCCPSLCFPLVAAVTGNFLHSITILRRMAALSIRMNAPISLRPSELEMKSSIWATDNALQEPCGSDALGAPSKKNSTGT
jgi:hypothetical protein